MRPSEGLALYEHHEADQHPELFFPRDLRSPSLGTSKRLRPMAFYIAIRFNAIERTRAQWQAATWLVRNHANGRFGIAKLVDWGPAEHLGRVVDLSPGLAQKLEVTTDQIVEVEEVCPA